MKESVTDILNKYLSIYPLEKDKLNRLFEFINTHKSEEITDWNNFDGHIVSSGFIYAKNDKKFLVLFHNDFKRYVYPGGHVDSTDKSILDAAKREIKEESGIDNFKLVSTDSDENVPMDIDIHLIGYNERLDLPEHYHFDFRYFFVIDSISDIKVDPEEHFTYKWIDVEEFINNCHYGDAINKILNLIKKN